ncbi:hypothetical protein AVEN_119424-1 [Araneus ventricosus]|uniref:Uncharacterized protein n=1 Tax=Araneus ventricosus TaxID=182803 RepID=A0A4Y2R5E6_ARAVE|nr:hypothetical protein AVEN_119424-1 [Araneus ventricosus]
MLFLQSEIEHFECCHKDLKTSDASSDEDIVSPIKEKNDVIDESSSDMEDVGDASSDPDAKAAVNIFQIFFATETMNKSAMY